MTLSLRSVPVSGNSLRGSARRSGRMSPSLYGHARCSTSPRLRLLLQFRQRCWESRSSCPFIRRARSLVGARHEHSPGTYIQAFSKEIVTVMKVKLPKKFLGAAVIRGLGTSTDKVDALEQKAVDHFDATRDLYLVVTDKALKEIDVRAFTDRKDAVQYARALANGNCDYRVLQITKQTLVIATENEL